MPTDLATWRGELAAAVAAVEAAGVRVALEVRRPDTVRYGHRADEPARALTTVKLGVLAELFRQADAGLLSLDQVHRLRAAATPARAGILEHLHDGLELTLGDLAALMTVASDAAAADLLVERLGSDAVHTGLRRMGLTRTALGSRFGESPDAQDAGEPGQAEEPGDGESVTTAQELVALLAALVEGTATTPASARRITSLLRAAPVTRGSARHLPAEIGRGGKDAARARVVADVLFADLPDGRLYLAVLLDGVADEVEGERLVADLARVACGF